MSASTRKINLFLLVKLPAAFFTGVRAKYIDSERCTTAVTHKWVNQNPFKSMFWAVQGMAAELSTGALVLQKIRVQQKPISMLVANNKATFTKKARGKIMFECTDGLAIQAAIERAISTSEGQTCWMKSKGIDSQGDVVSEFEFEWTVKLKQVKS